MNDDQKFYDQLSVPNPSLCPDCRQQRRLAFRNERFLYHRKCDLTGKEIISIYRPDSPYKVYSQDEWWSDKWDPLDYGRDFDFSKTFFEQFEKLTKDVPRIALVNMNNVNSDYVNWVMASKNCYLVTAARDNEDCLYSHWIWRSKDCMDCGYIYDSELCYQCVDCSNGYNLYFSQDCSSCKDSYFLRDCSNCSDCFCCVGLKEKQYYIFNEKYDKKSYESELKKYLPLKNSEIEEVAEKLISAAPKVPTKYYHGYSVENCIGDYMLECKDCFWCFDIDKSQGCRYGENIMRCTDTVDCARTTLCELCFECLSAVNSYEVKFCIMTWFSKNCMYCDGCNSCKNCFGCIGLKSKEYCIFNKQYSKEEYEKLVSEIVEYMKKTSEWGEFFPVSLSPFGYNETVANEFYPLEESEALKLGAKWSDYETGAQFHGGEVELPETVDEVDDEILNKILICEGSGKPYRVIAPELRLYRKIKVPVPHKSPNQRHKDRIGMRNPRKLWKRECTRCGKEIRTTYATNRPEIIYCEECYLKEVY